MSDSAQDNGDSTYTNPSVSPLECHRIHPLATLSGASASVPTRDYDPSIAHDFGSSTFSTPTYLTLSSPGSVPPQGYHCTYPLATLPGTGMAAVPARSDCEPDAGCPVHRGLDPRAVYSSPGRSEYSLCPAGERFGDGARPCDAGVRRGLGGAPGAESPGIETLSR